jgi:AraC-like DNA-binding protein
VSAIADAALVTNLPRHDWLAVRRITPDRVEPQRRVVHDHASIALYLDGRAKFWMRGLYALGPGDLLLVPDGTPHYLVEASGARSIGVSLCLSCAPLAVRDHLVAAFDVVRRGGCAVRRLGADESRRLEAVLLELEAELSQKRAGAGLAVDAGVSLLTVAILRAAEGSAAERLPGASPVVARALEFVHRRGATGISLSDVPAHVSRSPAHVASLVKGGTGVTVVGWITRARMNESRQLLLHTEESVEVVAERCGFASPSHFHRAFKRAHGMSPGEWRRAHRA